MNELRVEALDQFNVAIARFGVGVSPVFKENFVHRPLLNLADASDDTTCAVAALVAMDINWVVHWIQGEQYGVAESVEVGLNFALLVRFDIEYLSVDAVLPNKLVVVLTGLRLGDKGEYRFEL